MTRPTKKAVFIAFVLAFGCSQQPAEPIDQAALAIKQSDWDTVIATCDQILASSPNDTEALMLRGRAYVGRGDYEPAVADFSEIIRQLPNESEAYYNRQIAYQRLGETDLANKDGDLARELDVNHELAYPNSLAPPKRAPLDTSPNQTETATGEEDSPDELEAEEDKTNELLGRFLANSDGDESATGPDSPKNDTQTTTEKGPAATQDSQVVSDLLNPKTKKLPFPGVSLDESGKTLHERWLAQQQRFAAPDGDAPALEESPEIELPKPEPPPPQPVSTALPQSPDGQFHYPGFSPRNARQTGIDSWMFSTRFQAPVASPVPPAQTVIPGRFHANPIHVPNSVVGGITPDPQASHPSRAGTRPAEAVPTPGRIGSARPAASTALSESFLQQLSAPRTTGIQSGSGK